MVASSALRRANLLRITSRTALLLIGVVVVAIALIMGADLAGEGVDGLIANAPNALPWALLLGLVWLGWKHELVGGILITLAGLWMVYFFNSGPTFWLLTFAVTLVIPLCGLGLLGSWWLRRTSNDAGQP